MYRRNGKILPMLGVLGWLVGLLKTERSFADLAAEGRAYVVQNRLADPSGFWATFIKSLEALVGAGWVHARTEPGAQTLPPVDVDFSPVMHPNEAPAPG